MKLCYFNRFTSSPCRYRADGQPDRAHMIPQQRMKQEYKTRKYRANDIAMAIWDHRIIVPACRRHHDAFDQKQLRLLLNDYPVSTHEYAKEYGWYFAGERDGWRPNRGEIAA
jgi:hypothetical protein